MTPKKIVFVDDDEQLINLMRIELETEGFEVSIATDGQSGLKLIRDVIPDLVILDVMMPKLDGFHVLKILKEDVSTKAIPVIMLTARGLGDEVQEGLDLGAVDYLSKPFHARLLLQRIKTNLETME